MGRPIQLSHRLVVVVGRVKEYMDKHPLENKTTEELAFFGGISRNLLQKAFKEIHGIHVKEYYTTQKLKSAKRMLKEGMPIRQVARHCHYRSHSAFTTAFKNKFGIAPMVWLKKKG